MLSDPSPLSGNTQAARRSAPFHKARKYARSLRLQKRDQWRRWVKTHRAELDAHQIPSRPDKTYRTTGWVSWSDWLGSNLFQPKRFMTYEQWRAWLVAQPIRTQSDYNDWCKDHPHEREQMRIPSSPAAVYAQFRTWRDELSHVSPSKRVTATPRTYVPFTTARTFARTAVRSPEWNASGYAKTLKGWHAYARNHRPLLSEQHIPASPDSVAQYRQNWRGWRDFLGTNTRSTLNRKR